MNTKLPLWADLPRIEKLREHFIVLRGFVHPDPVFETIESLIQISPWRNMRIASGALMSVQMSNCGHLGWISDHAGYRYCRTDPQTHNPWPDMPAQWLTLADQAARVAGFASFSPDACLMNRYQRGTRLGLHRDQDEADFSHPIVSVSLGASARFMLGGLHRQDPTQAVMLNSGDVLVWGGPDRLVYHGVGVPRQSAHSTAQATDSADAAHAAQTVRINLTFRKAGRDEHQAYNEQTRQK
ncbi:MAG: alpha-ketoglutarate-dependent dioxygenase AlkB [Burkholderiaceae bacterium]